MALLFKFYSNKRVTIQFIQFNYHKTTQWLSEPENLNNNFLRYDEMGIRRRLASPLLYEKYLRKKHHVV